jgi:hypothetical protein
LENRRILAVVVFQTPAGDLLIAGDAAADSIVITENNAGNQWEVRGTGGTLVNGLTVSVQNKPTLQDVYILLEGGNDSLTMRGINQGAGALAVTFSGRVEIDMGLGADTVNLGSLAAPVTGDFNFVPAPGPNGSNANDFIDTVSVLLGGGATATVATDATNALTVLNTSFGRVAGASANGRLDIDGSVGVDTIEIRGVINSAGSIDIRTQGGGDAVRVGVTPSVQTPENPPPIPSPQDAVQIGGSLTVDGGDGADSIMVENALAVGNIVLHGGAGADSIRSGSAESVPAGSRVGSSTRGDLVIHGGDGADNVFVNQATTVNSFLVNVGDAVAGGAGNSVVVRNSSFGNDSAILGGAHADNLDLDAVNLVTNLYLQTGGGNDSVNMQGTLVTAGALTINTGAGDDEVVIDNTNIRTLLLIAGDGNDDVSLLGNLIDDFFGDLGAGNDSIQSESAYRNRGFVRGGPGANSSSGSNFDQGGNFEFEGF